VLVAGLHYLPTQLSGKLAARRCQTGLNRRKPLGFRAADGPHGVAAPLRVTRPISPGGTLLNARNHDEWTIDQWRTEPRWRVLEDVDEPPFVEHAPPLWKDVTVASIGAVLLWGAAVVLFG
jgi:hypothetical protein